MRKMIKGYFLGVLSTLLLVGSVAYAASNTQTIEVIYDNIKVFKDNVLCETRDANGTIVEPFIYNGTTYMPVRGTANLAGMEVTWDGESKSVYLWDELVPAETYFIDVCPPYELESESRCKAYASTDTKSFSMAGKKYSTGLTLTAGYSTTDMYALFNLDGKYKSIEMVIAPVDGGNDPSDIAFLVDGKKVAEFVVEGGDYPKTISVPLNHGLQLKIVAIDDSGHDETGLGNITVK